MDPNSFAVVDCETTGLHPGAHHRIIEFAVVTLDDDWRLKDVWCTLLSPERDLGPTDIHGIRGRDVRDAPTFDEVLGEVLDRLAGRILVAHNARFDRGFLENELTRLGFDLAPLPTLCTMELATRTGVGNGRSRLGDCCAAIGAAVPEAHTAQGDAVACAELLAACVRESHLSSLETLIHGHLRARKDWPKSDHRAPCHARSTGPREIQEPSFLARLVEDATMQPGVDAIQVAPYLDVLDRAIEDRRLSQVEQDELAAVAMAIGLSADRVRKLHGDYLATLVALARRDGIVTEHERADLLLVAEALGIEGVLDLLDRPMRLQAEGFEDCSLAGTSVCFTGALTCHHEGRLVTRERACELAEAAGMVVAPRVTKKLDMLVVAGIEVS